MQDFLSFVVHGKLSFMRREVGTGLSIMPNILEYSIYGVKSVRARGRSRTTVTSKMELFVIIAYDLDVAAVLDLPLQVTEVFKIEYKFVKHFKQILVKLS